jgi:DNA-binding winged helix-turn-helix (wHTH) protein
MNERATRRELYAFGPFRLDVAERTLARNGVGVPLRAKLFDTLVTLLRHAGRLVTREELIAAVWPDSIVEEGNLSHNVSALRKVLRDGARAKYIETVPKRGYRFLHALEEPGGGEPPPEDELARARRFLAEGAWDEAYLAFVRAREAGALPGCDGAGLAQAARWSGRFEELVPLLEDAAEAYRREGDSGGAARCALELGFLLLERGRPALAASHARQAERVLSAEAGPGVRERAELARLQGRLRWVEGDWEGALERSRAASQLSRTRNDPSAEAMALMDSGHSLLALQRFEEAAAELEEAGAVVTSGELEPYAVGLTLCGLIYAWRALGHWDRAAEWVDASIRWADGAGVAYFPGLCRIHRGQLICLRGELARAEEDLALGTRELSRADSVLAGQGLRELGTVRLRRGDLAGAEEAFRSALELGTDPQPGLAHLRAARGESEAACRDLERFLSDDEGAGASLLDREYGFEVRCVHVSLALATGAVEAARSSVERLREVAAATGSSYHRAGAGAAAGELALSEGRTAEALSLLQRSWRAWTKVPAPYEAAGVREKIGAALVAEGDVARARMELEGAAETYERLGAELDLGRLRTRLRELGPQEQERPPRVVACGEVVRAELLQAALGEEAWHDLSSWLERMLTGCWSDHGGRPLPSDSGYAVAFDDLASCLGCAARVHRSLRDHRKRHGFAPELRLAVVDAAALGAESDPGELRELARGLARAEGSGEVALLADAATVAGCPAVDRLREEGVRVQVVPPA